MSQYSGVTGRDSESNVFPAIKVMQQSIQMDNDALSILGNGPLLVAGEEGMKDIRIVQAAFASAAQNGKRIVL
jgi:glucose-fructose oxidoreductase